MNKDTHCCENCRGFGATQVKTKKAVSLSYCKNAACVCHTSKTKDTLGGRFDERFVGGLYEEVQENRKRTDTRKGDWEYKSDSVKDFIKKELERLAVEVEKERLVLPDPKKVKWSHDYNSAVEKAAALIRSKAEEL